MMDFDKTAREIARYWDQGSPEEMASQIAAALKAAYNEGLEDAASECDSLQETWRDAAEKNTARSEWWARSHQAGDCAGMARAKKVP